MLNKIPFALDLITLALLFASNILLLTKRRVFIFMPILLIFVLCIANFGLVSILDLVLLSICILGLFASILVNRSYIYYMSILVLILIPLFILINLNGIAEYFGVLAFLLLCMGVFRDLFYEKIFN